MVMRRQVIAGLTLLALMAGAVAVRRTGANPVLRSVLSAAFPRAVVVDARHGRAYVIGSDRTGGHIWVLDTATGQVLMTVSTADTPGGVALDARHARLFVGNGTSPTVSMYDATSGVLLHAISVGGWPQDGTSFMGRELVVSELTGRVFVANPYGGGTYSTVNVLDAISERMLRTVAVGQGLTTLLTDERSHHVFGIIGVDDTVSVLDASTGTVLRTAHTVPVHTVPLALAVDERTEHVFVTSNKLYAGAASVNTRGYVDMLDARTGTVLRTVAVGILPLAVAVDERRGRVFVANSGSNTVSVLDARTGRVVRTVHVGRNPAALAVDSRAGRVVVVNSARPYLFPDRAGGTHGSVSILDAGSGSVRATMPAGVAPDAVAVDESTGRAFVVNSGAGRQLHVSDAWAWLPSWLRSHIPFLAAEPARGRTVPAGSVSVLDLIHS